MTAVTSWTGIDGVIQLRGSTVAYVKFNLDVKRNVASAKRGASWSALNRPGSVEVTGSITQILTDAQTFRALISSTATTGTAEQLVAASEVLDASDNWTANTTDCTTPSRIQLKLQTKAATVAGTATCIGTDAAGHYIEETLTIPATMAINDTLTTTKIFGHLDGVYHRDADSADDLGTFLISGIAGDATATIDAGEELDIIGSVVSGTNNVTFTVPNCFLTGGSIEIADADTMIECSYPFVMKDAAADFVLGYVNA